MEKKVKSIDCAMRGTGLPWCSNCKNGENEEENGKVYIFCNQIKAYRLEDDFCGLHEWRDIKENESL